MMHRVYNQKDPHYKSYGGRGILVCKRWHTINNFIIDMYPTYQKGFTLDRVDNDGNYEPSNIRWATHNIQCRNTRKLMSTNTSGYRGVSFDRNKYTSVIHVNKKRIRLGRFNTALEAAIAYDKYVIENGLEHTINGVLI